MQALTTKKMRELYELDSLAWYETTLAQIKNNHITAGPPVAQAFPTELKIPPPIIAAIPKKVKSLTVSILGMSLCSAVSEKLVFLRSNLCMNKDISRY
jgi:hypothetical protein